jgi:predicted transcriptional regulator
MRDPLDFAGRLRALLPMEDERLLDARYEEAIRAVHQCVAKTMPDMTIAAVMQRWAQEIADLSLAEQLRAGHDKLAVLRGLGFAQAETLVADALAQAEQLSEEALACQPSRRDRGTGRV